jgi:SAM-dependent methyltransferase
MLATDRLDAEMAFHDTQAAHRASRFRDPAFLRFRDEDWLSHESWIAPAVAHLGDLAGCDLLDLGCGHAMASVVFARQAARVTALDLSLGYLTEGRRRATANEVAIKFVHANAEQLPFADESFDRIWGNAVLHHLDLEIAGAELRRVLRPGGVAVFCEPAGDNPLLNFARRWLPYPGKHRTRDEKPLVLAELEILRRAFPMMEIESWQLLAMCHRVLGMRAVRERLDVCDRWLLKNVPILSRLCRYRVLICRRDL